MTDSFPIDINYNDLINWLNERYLIPTDWPIRLEAIKQKKQEFLEQIHQKDSPDFEKIKTSFQLDSELTYEDIKRLQVMILKTEEAKGKTLFGSYTSPIINNINNVIKIYEKNNVFLCEYAKLFIQYLNYDIENSDKIMKSNERSIDDYEVRISEREETVCKLKIKLLNKLSLYEIDGFYSKIESFLNESLTIIEMNQKFSDIYKEISIFLSERLFDLKFKLNEICKLIEDSKTIEGIDFYMKFFKELYSHDLNSMFKNFLREIQIISKEGDRNILNNDQYRFLESSNSNKGDIYEFLNEKKEKYISLFKNIDQFKSYIKIYSESSVEIKEESNNDNISSLLLNEDFNTGLISNVDEIKSFLKVRQQQSIDNIEITFSIYSPILRQFSNEYSEERIKEILSHYELILSKLNSIDLKMLIRLYESERIVFRIVSELNIIIEGIYKSKDSVIIFNNKIQELKENISQVSKSKDVQIKEIKTFKKIVEKTLTNALKRKISIIGNKNLF